MVEPADRMTVVGMRVPIQTPAPLDVAVVCSPEDADSREDAEQDACVEDA
jgi:hypothetical protein